MVNFIRFVQGGFMLGLLSTFNYISFWWHLSIIVIEYSGYIEEDGLSWLYQGQVLKRSG